jgi:hypothetical protein
VDLLRANEDIVIEANQTSLRIRDGSTASQTRQRTST